MERKQVPKWIPDEDRPWCFICKRKFGFFILRRHHCRCCGEVICGSCSPYREILLKFLPVGWPNVKLVSEPKDFKNYSYASPLRICKMCFIESRLMYDQLYGLHSFNRSDASQMIKEKLNSSNEREYLTEGSLKEEQERLRKEQEEQEEKELLKKEQEEQERLKKEQEEKERLRKEQEEQERLRKEQEEKERLRKEQEEQERLLSIATLTLQSVIKFFNERFRFVQIERQTLLLQCFFRAYLARRKYSETLHSIVVFQMLIQSIRAKNVCQTLAKMASRRKKIALEILATERNYVDALSVIEEVFMHPLFGTNIIPKENLLTIFSNIGFILKFHLELLRKLEERIEGNPGWFPHQSLGDILLDSIQDFKACYTPFVKNYKKSSDMFEKCIATLPEFENFILEAEKNPRCNLLSFQDLMIMGIQRLPRYELLVSDLLRHTDPNCKDYKMLERALLQLRESINFVNEQKREWDSLSRILIVQDKAKGHKPNLVRPGRMLIREGLLRDVDKKGKEKDVYVFLFNDTILCSKQKLAKKANMGISASEGKYASIKYDFKSNLNMKKISISDLEIIPSQQQSTEESDPSSSSLSSFALNNSKSPSPLKRLPLGRAESTTLFPTTNITNPECCFKLLDQETGKISIWKADNILEKKAWMADIQNALQNLANETKK